MKRKEILTAMLSVVVLFGMAGPASAAWEGGRYWADEVAAWTGDVQNYGLYASAEMMTSSTTWWLTGRPDSDVNGNGYGWDYDPPVDKDFVAGWRQSGAAEFIVHFNVAAKDVAGDDLVIVTYGGPNGQSSVYASSDNLTYVNIGTIGGGTAGYFEDLWFDFGGQVDDVQYVKVVRDVWGPKSGRFFDAVGYVPEPTTMALLACGGACLLIRRRRAVRPGSPKSGNG